MDEKDSTTNEKEENESPIVWKIIDNLTDEGLELVSFVFGEEFANTFWLNNNKVEDRMELSVEDQYPAKKLNEVQLKLAYKFHNKISANVNLCTLPVVHKLDTLSESKKHVWNLIARIISEYKEEDAEEIIKIIFTDYRWKEKDE